MKAAVWAIFLLFLPNLAAADSTVVTGGDVAARVERVLDENHIIAVAVIAPERRYFPCDTDLQVAPRVQNRWDALNVSCALPVPWSIIIRTEGQIWDENGQAGQGGPATQSISAVVLRQSARKGQLIIADMLDVAQFENEPAQGYFTDPAEIMGRRLTTNVASGVPIRERHLRPAWAVEAGQAVSIEKDLGGINVATSGIALENGAIGDMVSVRNVSSNKVLQGFVSDKNKISVSANIN